MPDDTLPAVWAPELAAIMGSRIGDKSGVRLLANTIAHQWWGSEVSPRTLNDAWITNGMSRYGELMYLEDESGKSAMRAALQDVSAGALAYDTIPLSSVRPADPFSPEFQSMTLEKGAMIFHMLRWEIGDKAFLATLKGALSQYTDRSIRADDFEQGGRGAKPAAVDAVLRAVDRRHGRAAHSPTSTPSTGSATTRASAPSARSTRISTCSACRSICASRPTARPKTRRSTWLAPIRNTSSTPSAARAASASIPATGCSSLRRTCRCASPS